MERKYFISSSPHITDNESIPKIMFSVIGALIPAGIAGIFFFGMHAFWVIVVASITAVITEFIFQYFLKRPISISDGSAILTGILLAYNLPAEVPLWLPAIGAFIGIAIGKISFGGLGYNPLNPALVGRAFLMASWPLHMTIFQTPPKGGTLSGIDLSGIDAISEATPLNVFASAREILLHSTENINDAQDVISRLYNSYTDLFIGKVGGCIGETSALLLLIGGFFLMYKRIIGWKIPVSYLSTVALLSWIFGGTEGYFTGAPTFHILSGGLILGAFFMATDMVTTPVTFKGRLIFGMGCGILTTVIRLYGGYPEGVSYSILLMNLATPLLDKYTKPKKFGGTK